MLDALVFLEMGDLSGSLTGVVVVGLGVDDDFLLDFLVVLS